MFALRRVFAAVLAAVSIGCGGSGDATSPDNSNAGGGKTLTATYNGANFVPTLLTSAYFNGQVGVTANDNGGRNLLISGLNVNAPGTYSVAAGNPNSLLAQWVDGNVGSFSTGGVGTGTVTFTVLQLGRVAGSFNVVARNQLSGGTPTTMTLVGSFDIKFP